MAPFSPALPRVVAHRGASATHPENTLAAFDAALDEGCDGIELDVQLSSDGIPVVYHDRTLAKAGRGRTRVWRVPARELTSLDAGSWFAPRFRGQRIPTLERVFSRFGRNTRLLVEIKARDADRRAGVHLPLAAAVAALIRRHRLERRVLVLSFDRSVLAEVADRAPRVLTALNVRPPRRMTARLRSALREIDVLSADVRGLTPSVARAARRSGKPVMAWTCNTPAAVRRALEAGAETLIADRPGRLRERLARLEDA